MKEIRSEMGLDDAAQLLRQELTEQRQNLLDRRAVLQDAIAEINAELQTLKDRRDEVLQYLQTRGL